MKINSGTLIFTGLLQVIFIVLKLNGVIDWSWWLVLLPIIIWLALFLFCLLLIGIVAVSDN